jgi:hypothetical protein
MWPIAAINVVPGQRRWAVAGGSNVAAAVLNTTSCSVMRTGVEVCRVGLTPAEAGPITGAAGLDSKCNMCGCLRDDWWLRAGATVSEHLEDKHHHGRNTSSKLMRSDLSFPQASMPAVGALVRCTDGAYMVRPPQDCRSPTTARAHARRLHRLLVRRPHHVELPLRRNYIRAATRRRVQPSPAARSCACFPVNLRSEDNVGGSMAQLASGAARWAAVGRARYARRLAQALSDAMPQMCARPPRSWAV